MQTQIQALNQSGSEVSLRATEGGVQILIPAKTLWTAKGYGRQAMATSAVAALVVRPSTTAMATLYNNTSKNFFIDRAFAHNLVSTANSVYGLWLCVHPAGMTAPTNDITARNGLSGNQVAQEGIFDNGATVVADGWFPWGKSGHTVTITTPGEQLEAEVDCRIILPPTAAISLQVVADVTGATFTAGFAWYSVPTSELAVA